MSEVIVTQIAEMEAAADDAAWIAWPSAHDYPEREAYKAGYLKATADLRARIAECEGWLKTLAPIMEDVVNDYAAFLQEGGRGQPSDEVNACSAALQRLAKIDALKGTQP